MVLGKNWPNLAGFASNFQKFLHPLRLPMASLNEIEGGLYGIYYSNKDTKLLLDLLAECSGIGPCLKLLCLLDKSLLENAKCNYMNTFLQDPDSDGCRDVIVEFNDSKAVKDIFCQIPKALCTYSLEISPPVFVKLGFSKFV